MSLDRLSTGLGIAVVLLALSNVYLWRTGADLEAERDALASDLKRVRAEKKDARPEPDRAPAGRVAAARGPRRGGKAAELLAARGGPAGLPPAAQERMVQIRDHVRNQALERVVLAVERTGQERGWEGSTIDEVAAILEDSFYASSELREAARAREIEPAAARDEMTRVREQAQADLDELLGETEHAALRDNMRSSGASDAVDAEHD